MSDKDLGDLIIGEATGARYNHHSRIGADGRPDQQARTADPVMPPSGGSDLSPGVILLIAGGIFFASAIGYNFLGWLGVFLSWGGMFGVYRFFQTRWGETILDFAGSILATIVMMALPTILLVANYANLGPTGMDLPGAFGALFAGGYWKASLSESYPPRKQMLFNILLGGGAVVFAILSIIGFMVPDRA